MRFFDFFAGIGGFRLGMEMAGHECVGHCEIDKYAHKSYVAMHQPKESEVFFKDVRTIEPELMPECECYCFGFPCQAFSISGKRRGFDDARGTLFFEVMRIAKERKPEILFAENVAGLLNHEGGVTFGVIISTMAELGYSCEWQVLNSKDFGVPQHRQRVFIIGHLGRIGGRTVFPITENSGTASELQGFGNRNRVVSTPLKVGGSMNTKTRRGRVIDEGDTSPTLQADCAVGVIQVGQVYGGGIEPNPQAGRIYSKDGLSPTLDSMGGGNRMPKVIVAGGIGEKKSNGGQQFFQQDRVYDTEGIAPALAENKSDLNIIQPKIVAERGRGEGWQQQLEERDDGLTNSLTSATKDNMVSEGIRIRKLTPKECFRLQGFPDEYFERAASVCSDSQLYKQAGNSVTVNVIYEIAKRLKEIEE